MKKHSNVHFYKGLPPEGALVKWFKPEHHGILILDDLMEESGNDKRVLDLFTKDSHHRAAIPALVAGGKAAAMVCPWDFDVHSLLTMDGISSTPVENSVQFLRLRDKYKSDLLDDSRLTKAAGLAAQQELLLESPAPDSWKEPRLKSVNRQLRHWTTKIRQPGGVRAIGRDDDDPYDDDANNLAVGTVQQFMSNIAKIQKGIKRKATTPNFSFKTGSKGKRLLPKTPKRKKSAPSTLKTPEKSLEELATELPFSDQLGESPWKTPGELARDSLRAIRRRTRKSQSEERKKEGLKQTVLKKAAEKALKQLAPAPDWKPFGIEFHLPGYNYAGPGTKLAKRLKRGDKGINRLDDIALHHDIAYSKAKNLQDKWKADDVMIKAIDRLPGKKTMTEKVVKKIMQAKRKLKL
ncbi:unnamed protein product [Porites lobata]|uniref:Phospholipase A2-like domain-containing protein n=1 Tax=Porites lobata TaxID=104759 RepID=A0ABN8RAN8_9CNID|nr:unnamed protein product [Porites lobata]